MKTINGKAIYSPKGKAGEYGKYACNFYVGCSNQCEYCYLRKGIGKATLGGDTPTLKKCFRDKAHAMEVFDRELKSNLSELQEHGLFFSFTTDPCLPSTFMLTYKAIQRCYANGVPVKILTKQVDWIKYELDYKKERYGEGFEKIVKETIEMYREFVATGWTLTGHDELEPNASTNAERIETMRRLHHVGFKTWASIEPIIDFESSLSMIKASMEFCFLYKIGLESGKEYKKHDAVVFLERCLKYAHLRSFKIYFKDSLLKVAGILREDLPGNCVTRDYNVFNDK